MKLTTGLENVKGVVNSMTFLSLQLVEIDKNYRSTLPRWNSLCHRLSRDQPQPGSFFQRPSEAEKRDPGNEVDPSSRENLVMTSAYERPYVRTSVQTRVEGEGRLEILLTVTHTGN